MIPYVALPSFEVLPGIAINAYGLVVSIGVLIGNGIAVRAAARLAPQEVEPLRGILPWAVIPGILVAHLVHLLAYHPEELSVGQLFRVWEGLSSTGGFIGGALGGWAYYQYLGRKFVLALNPLALGLSVAWAMGRVGCFMVHDHPGRLTDFPLAVAFPGGARHDLGLYEAAVLAGISFVLFYVSRRVDHLRPGQLMGLLAVLYAPSRFALDFLRASDVPYHDARYAGFTPAQFVMAALFSLGIWLLLRRAPTAPSVPVTG